MNRWLALAALIAALDQLSKFAITRRLIAGNSIELTPFFNLVRVHNRGAAFSLFSSASGWQREFFIAIAVIASVWVVYLLRRHPRESLFCLALSLILGGAIGNVIDRLLHGHVVDFIQWHWRDYFWPAFNIADAAIVVGAVSIAAYGLLAGKREKSAAARPE